MLMRMMDEQSLKTPFYGVRRMCIWLRSLGYVINKKRVRRLMRQMGLQAVYPRPRTSLPGDGHKIYPYLLNLNSSVERPRSTA